MPGSGWRVTSQLTDQVENNLAGQTLVGVRVYFITGEGNEGSVFVPNSQYTEARVKHLVYERGLLIDKVGNLASDIRG